MELTADADTSNGSDAESGSSGPRGRRITFNLSEDTYGQLAKLASKRGLPLVQALSQAVGDKFFIDEAQSRGAAVELREPDGSRVRVVFR